MHMKYKFSLQGCTLEVIRVEGMRSIGHVCIFSHIYAFLAYKVNPSRGLIWAPEPFEVFVSYLTCLFSCMHLIPEPSPLPFVRPVPTSRLQVGVEPGNTLFSSTTLLNPGVRASFRRPGSPGQLFQVRRSGGCLLIKPAMQPRHCGPDTSWNVLHHP